MNENELVLLLTHIGEYIAATSYNIIEAEKMFYLAQDAIIYLDYLKSQGFNPDNYKQILELNQSVLTSMSHYLAQNQFLLSNNVKYKELRDFGIKGAKGYIHESGIYIPKSSTADEYFLYGDLPKIIGNRHGYSYPKLLDCDVVISKGISPKDNLKPILETKIDFYFGDVLNISDPNFVQKKGMLIHQLDNLNEMIDYNGLFTIDMNSSTQFEFICLSRKKKRTRNTY